MKKVYALIVALFAAVALCACAPANGKKAEAKMDKAGFKGAYVENSIFKGDVEGTLTGIGYTATLYSSAKAAKEVFKATKNEDGKSVCKLVGKWVFIGTEDAYKAFK